MARKAILRALAGAEPPPLPPVEGRGRNSVRREEEEWWVVYGLRAGLTRRQLMTATGRSMSTIKRRIHEARLRLSRSMSHERGLALELASRCRAALRGEQPPPLTAERERELLAVARKVAGPGGRIKHG